MPKSKDLFDDSTMSFGEHLEALRVHLFKSLIGLLIAVTVTLFISDRIIAIIRRPIDIALKAHYTEHTESIEQQGEQLEELDWWEEMQTWVGLRERPQTQAERDREADRELPQDVILVRIEKSDLERIVKEIDPQAEVDLDREETGEKTVSLPLRSPSFRELRKAYDTVTKPITLNVQEAFMIYLKVALISGLLISFPWIFYQLWMFVAAGLYEHEKRYVYVFLPVSMVLFFSGAVFCYFGVFPFVLSFLLDFNDWLGVTPQIRLSEWITFALMLPLMFGISFQLPLVMFFVERLGIVSAAAYQEKRRLAVLVIATLSMFLTPAEPMSMIMMMIPLILLYELGIIFCRLNPMDNPYETA